jgi:hypothetical protein
VADLATLSAWRDDLEEKIARGVLTGEYDGRRITYQSTADMQRALAGLNAQIDALSGTAITDIVFTQQTEW